MWPRDVEKKRKCCESKVATLYQQANDSERSQKCGHSRSVVTRAQTRQQRLCQSLFFSLSRPDRLILLIIPVAGLMLFIIARFCKAFEQLIGGDVRPRSIVSVASLALRPPTRNVFPERNPQVYDNIWPANLS